jgi:hypothetical protein
MRAGVRLIFKKATESNHYPCKTKNPRYNLFDQIYTAIHKPDHILPFQHII